ncbi:MAG: hypothetical protein LBT09_02360 [Planctomycetaceae bacterium]|nr:hypothetical protein [Planctomycetaceae bacterium]
MKKIFTIALICATIGFFSTGCVDVAGPGGTTPANPNNPTNPSVPTDPNDPMYPGETGVNYTTNWTGYDTTISPQRYVGADYGDSNEADVAPTIADEDTAPYKTTFPDGTICYSVVKFPLVTYSEDDTATDCYYEGTAIDGFALTDYEYSDGEIKFKGEGTETVASGTTDGNYRTIFYLGDHTTTRVTNRPYFGVTYYKNSDGSHYIGTHTTNSVYHCVTKWSDGEYMLSHHKFSDVDYSAESTSAYSSGNTTTQTWSIGTAPEGHKESDYTLVGDVYQYNADASGAATANPADTANSSNPTDDVIDDVEDALGDILDNDGISLRQ